MPEIDWEGTLWDTIPHLQALIRIDTVNPPGNEIGAARYLDDVLRGHGIETALFQPAPRRAALVARLRGNGAARPVLLLAHMDVVGVEREQWKQNPFGGSIVDGFLYGRGAIDDKGMLAVNLETMLLLKRYVVDAGGVLARDVVFIATSDEETGGPFGIDWLIANHPEALDAEFALNEGGRIRTMNDVPLYGAVQCAEKVPHGLTVRARGTSGHASVPLPDNAIFRLSRALAAIGAHSEPLQLTESTRRFFAGLATVWRDRQEATAMADVASGDAARVAKGASRLSAVPAFDAALRNGISATLIGGGIRTNVIPAEASATLNVRTLPGASIDDVIDRLQALIEPGVDVTVRSRGEDAPESPTDSPMFTAIRDSLQDLEPSLAVVPYLSTGATDSAALRRLGVKAYGLLPFPLSHDDEARMHGHDERVPVASLGFGIRLEFEILRRIAVAGESRHAS
jgi:acetylornithine deacetylase/succinyl-diaminopimelate desuccinylase-like protein